MAIFEVSDDEIARLDDRKLTDLLRRLLNLEAEKHGIRKSGVNVALNITTPDDGIDGSIKWNDGPERTDYIVSRNVGYQCKATKMTSTKAGQEVESRRKQPPIIKSMVDQILSEGGSYILFTTTYLNDQQRINEAIESIRAKFRQHNKPYADSANIEIYDRSKIKTWVNEYLPSIVAVKELVGSPIDDGLQTLVTWGKLQGLEKNKFCSDETISQLLSDIRSQAQKPSHVMRIEGLSGIGKTRLVFEACKSSVNGSLASRIVYVDVADGHFTLPKKIPMWSERGYRFTLVVDNCEPSLHDALWKYVRNTDLTLITLDYNTDKNVCDNTYTIPTVSEKVIDEIIKQSYPNLDEASLRRIKDFANGFPLIAVKIAEDLEGKVDDIGNLREDLIKEKLLGEFSNDHYKAIQVCALFEYVGFEGQVSIHYKYIAEKIANLNPNEFYRCISTYRKRGLIDKRGDYIRVIPRPLAVRLAKEWWEQNSSEYIQEIIQLLGPDKAPQGLSDAFCQAIPKLSFVKRANELTEELCGAQGPFGHAEVLKSPWGSRLFRAFVEVNPKATTNAIYRITEALEIEELKNHFVGDSRRNLIWALEKLCFREECFSKAAWAMLRLAVAENESWSNNATGQFLQLFHVFLSGTEASPKLRLELVTRALQEQNKDIRKLAVRALGEALHTQHFTRSGGSEEQGTAPPLQDWRPQIWQEAFDYWEEVLHRLVDIVLSDDEFSDLAKNAIALQIRGLMQYGRVDALNDVISRIVSKRGQYWPQALESIKTTRKFDGNAMPPKALEALNRWENLLIPKDLGEKIKLLVCTPPWEHEKDGNENYIDVGARNAEAFAKECSLQIENIYPHLSLLVSGEIRQGSAFGKACIANIKNINLFLDPIIEALANCNKETANPIVAAAALSKLKQINYNLWSKYISTFENDDRLKPFYIDIIILNEPSSKELNQTLLLISNGFIDILKSRFFAYGRVLSHLSSKEVVEFCLKLAAISPDGFWPSFEILYMYCYGKPESWKSCKETLVIFIKKVDFQNNPPSNNNMDLHGWSFSITKLLEDGDAIPVDDIVNSIFSLLKEDKNVSIQNHDIKTVLAALFNHGLGEHVWEAVTKVLESGDHFVAWRLEILLTTEVFDSESRHLMFKLSEDFLVDWAEKHKDFGPKFLARAAPIYEKDENGNIVASSIAKKIVDRFGDDNDVLSALSSFAGIKGWSSSRVPELQREEKVYVYFEQHLNARVREWAASNLEYIRKTIAHETKRDEEQEWGIY